ncbi:hypothetical protein C8J56DRAFT_1061658 [Mycena floridula]|nr:hypothetical protein C8J56DRAFT_1061658 [Mycena floridula]
MKSLVIATETLEAALATSTSPQRLQITEVAFTSIILDRALLSILRAFPNLLRILFILEEYPTDLLLQVASLSVLSGVVHVSLTAEHQDAAAFACAFLEHCAIYACLDFGLGIERVSLERIEEARSALRNMSNTSFFGVSHQCSSPNRSRSGRDRHLGFRGQANDLTHIMHGMNRHFLISFLHLPSLNSKDLLESILPQHRHSLRILTIPLGGEFISSTMIVATDSSVKVDAISLTPFVNLCQLTLFLPRCNDEQALFVVEDLLLTLSFRSLNRLTIVAGDWVAPGIPMQVWMQRLFTRLFAIAEGCASNFWLVLTDTMHRQTILVTPQRRETRAITLEFLPTGGLQDLRRVYA